MSEDMSSERVSKDLSERMSEDMSERMSEDMSGRISENMSQVYLHTQIWITRIHVCTNGILWMASCFFVLFGRLQQVLLAQLCFCARK